MTQITLPYSLQDGDKAYAARLMADFNAICDAFNSGGSALDVSVTGLAATDAQAALQELQNNKLDKSGGTLTGDLTLAADPAAPMTAASKKYVDDTLIAIGAGDMAKQVYDPDEDGVFAIAQGGTGASSADTARAALKVAEALTADARFYVDGAAGSDSTGDGSASAPFATIGKAIGLMPKNLNGYVARIDIAAATYNELLTVADFSGGRLHLAVSGAVVIAGGLSIRGASCLLDSSGGSLSLQYAAGVSLASGVITVDEGATLIYGSLTIDCLSGNSSGFSVIGSGAAYCLTTAASASVSNCSCVYGAAFAATRGGSIYLQNAAGSGNTYGYHAYGGLIRVGTDGLTATTKVRKQMGGQVLTGAGVDLT